MCFQTEIKQQTAALHKLLGRLRLSLALDIPVDGAAFRRDFEEIKTLFYSLEDLLSQNTSLSP